MKEIEEYYKEAKEQFYVMAQEWFDKEIMREVYSCASFSICNVMDKFYAFFDFAIIKEGAKEPMGIAFNIRELDLFIKNSRNYYSNVLNGNLDSHILRHSFKVNEETLNRYLMLRKKHYGEGPSPNIDYEWEAKVTNITN